MRPGAAALLLLLAPACAPVLTHGPRVEPGLYAGSTGGFLIAQEAGDTPDVVTPGWTPYVRYGFTGKPGEVAGSLALALGNRIEGDAYLQLPARAEWVYGAGLMASPGYVMPYVQLGQSLGRGYEVYTTQAYVRRGDFNEKNVYLLDIAPTEVRPRYWASTVAIRRREGFFGASLQLTGAFGRYDERPTGSADGTPTTSHELRGVSASLTADVDVGQFFKDLAAITRRPVPRRPPGDMPP